MRRTLTIAVLLAVGLFAFASVASAQVEAICVPWKPSNPTIPHYTLSGAQTTLKGIARGGATHYQWDFGDGSPVATGTITNPYNLGVNHIYVGAPGDLFVATLTVNDGSDSDTDTYVVEIHNDTEDVRINMAIDEGLWWLHTTMYRYDFGPGAPGYGQPYGYWDPSYYPVAATGSAVDAFQLHGSRANTDYDSDPYVETVQRALNYLLFKTYAYGIGPQPYGNPDTNGNGIGLVTNHSSNLYDSRQTYIGGICMVALASSGAPNRVADVGGPHVYGRTYADIVQDMVDFFAWGQVDGGSGRGGWRYFANYSNSDMSTTQWPPLGMLAAEQNMGSVVPQFVRDELIHFLNYTFYSSCNNNHGGFGYSTYSNYLNITKAAAGIICHEFLHLTPSATPAEAAAKQAALMADPKVQAAIGFIYRHWNDSGTCWDFTKLHGNSYGMYGVMKAFRIPEPDIIEVTDYDCTVSAQTSSSFDWYYTPAGQDPPHKGLATYIVETQQTDGSWDDVVGCNRLYNAFATGWRVLVLLKGVTILPPEAQICDCDEQEYNLDQTINLDASCSYHPDITRHIVSWDWDLDDDGEFDDASGEAASIPGGFSATGYYPVSVRVTDDNPDYLGGPQTSIYTCQVYVHPPPHCPHAFAGGPYIGWVNTPVDLDASASWDPDNEIVAYEWDLDSDGEFDDATGVDPPWTWTAPFFGVIGVKVTDATGDFDPCSDIDSTTVEIGNHDPVSDPGGPYTAAVSTSIVLDGSGSYDPDPGDPITLDWDLDNDGQFDDSTDIQPLFPVGDVVGTVHDVCLRATDSYGETDVACATVTVVPNLPPVATCQDVTVSADGSCQALANVDNGSYDPDGDPIDLTQDPPAPYPLGDTFVTLTVTDDKGASDSCTATVTVVDTTPPAVGVTIPSSGDALQDVATFTASASDNCAVSQVYFYLREASAPETPFGYEDLPATYTSGNWEYGFDSTAVDDGYYVVLAKAVDASGNVGWSSVPCSIRNWAIVELLPASQEYRAGRTMPVKFSLRIAAAVDPAMPFVYNEALEIKIYDGASLEQASQYGDHSNDYRIDVAGELYITNFKTSKTPTTYTVEIWRLNKGFMIDSFDFTTARR